MKLSLGRGWDETKAVVRRDGKALAAIALALLVLPNLVAELATPNVAPDEEVPQGWWNILQLLALLISLAGQIAVTRIALGLGGTVGQAIGEGFRRMPSLFIALFLLVLPFALAVAAAMLAGGVSPAGEVSRNPVVALVLVVVTLAFLYVLIRALPITAVVASERLSPLAALKRSWSATRGHWGKLFLILLVIGLVTAIVLGGLQFALGSVIVLLAGTPDQWSLADLLLTLLAQLLGAVFSVIVACLVASIYRQLTAGGEAAPVGVPPAGHH